MKCLFHLLSLLLPALAAAQTTEFANITVVQNDAANNTTSVTVTKAAGSSPNFDIRAGSNRGDTNVTVGYANDYTTGVLITTVAENGRNNSAFGDTIGQFYATCGVELDSISTPVRYFIPSFNASSAAEEVNINLAAAHFPYSIWLGGLGRNATAANGGATDTFIGSPGIVLGTQFTTAGGGAFGLNLTSINAAFTAQNGVLLVSHTKNEDNYALSRANANGTFSMWVRDNFSDGTGNEQDPISFVYLHSSDVGTKRLACIGRVNSDGSADVAAGAFTVTKSAAARWFLAIPGQTSATGTLILSCEGGGTNNVDNYVSYQWDPTNAYWVIESRDTPAAGAGLPALQDGATAAEDMFSFAFFTTSGINQPPTVTMTAPASGTNFAQGSPLVLEATTSDTDGTVAKVEFYDGTTLLGEDLDAPYSFSVATPALGQRSFSARATDSGGSVGSSAAVLVTVQPPPGVGGLFFDGADDYVTFGNNPALALESFTLECWFRRDGVGVTASSGSGGVAAIPLITKGRGESDGSNVDCNYLFGIQGSTGRLAVDFEDMATGLNHPAVGTTTVPMGVWQHAAATFDAPNFEWRIYLNGALEAVVSTNGQVPRNDSIQHSAIAAALNSTGVREGGFFGVLDEVRIWNYPRTQAEIQQGLNAQIPSASGLVARWDMSEGAGTTLTSVASTTIAGTLTNGPGWTSGAPFNLNVAPSAVITAPANGASFVTPASFTISADASDLDGTVTQVEFLRDGLVIGTDTSAPFEMLESALGAGGYTYTARATDNSGAVATSAPVSISVAFDPLHPPSNAALRFDGVDDYVTMGVAPEFGLGGPPSNGLTLECWFRRDGAGLTSSSGSGGVSGVPLFGKGRGESDGSNVDCDYFFAINASGLLVADFETYPATGLSSGQNYPITGTHAPIQNGAWYHAAVTYDGSTATWHLYLNGVPAGTATAAAGARPRFDSIQHFGIATAMNSSGVREGAFAGRIDEVRVWNLVRTPAEILDGMGREIASAPGLVGRYGLNEASGTIVENSVDVIGDPLGTVIGNPTWVEGAPFTTSNAAPTVTLDAPTAGSSTVYPAPFEFQATANDTDGSIVRVEFFVEGVKVGEDPSAPYAFSWTPPAVGDYEVLARAIDDLGATGTSELGVLIVEPNPDQPPVVSAVSPAADATGIGGATTLQVSIADPEDDATVVTFYGRKSAPATPGPDFTLVTIPDTQYYSQNTGGTRFQHFLNQTNWIVQQRDTLNVAFVSHMGDIVENGDSIMQQWVNANQAMTILEDHATTLRAYGIPFGAAPGNHDQASIGNPESPSAGYNQYFPAARYLGRPYWGGNFGANNDNNYQLFSASGLDFIIIHLEYRTAVDPAVIDWADTLLKIYPHRRGIVTSHWIIGQGNPASFGGQGQGIYDGLKDNPNLFLLLCGHIHAEGRRTDTFEGRTVYSFLQDYQGSANGGNGFLRYFTFKPSLNQIVAQSYSPSLGRAVNSTDAVPAFEGPVTITYNMQGSVSDWIPLGTVDVPAGGTSASLPWTGLEAASHYEWYAEAFDGINDGTSAPRRFSTADDFKPLITLDAPFHGVTYTAPATLALAATASDPDGAIGRVDFFQGTTKLGSDDTTPYEFTTAPFAAGSYSFSAVAVDNSGDVKLSNIVSLTVADRTNNGPTIALTVPPDGSTVAIPDSVNLAATAADGDGAIAKVRFIVDGNFLSDDASASYEAIWTPSTTGPHEVTAIAFDNDGATATSSPAGVFVFADVDEDGIADDYEIANGLDPDDPLDADLDLDGDLLSNRLEYALDTAANVPNRAGLPVLGTGSGADAGKLTLTFTRFRGELSYIVRASDDLKTFAPIATNPGTLGAPVTVIDNNTSSPNRYLQLFVTDGASSAATVPLGRITYALTQNQETSVSFPLHGVTGAIGAIGGQPAGFITAVGASTLDNTNAGWTPGQLSNAATPYLLRITSGAAKGRTFPLSTTTANTATRLTLVTGAVNLAMLGIVAGIDTYELIPGETLATLFPAGTLLSGTVTTGDTLKLWNGVTWLTFFHNGANWQLSGGGNADNQLIRAEAGWLLRRRGPITTFTLLGQAPATDAAVVVPRKANTMTSLLPIERTFAEFPLQTLLPAWTSNMATPTAGDHVRLWNGGAWAVYFWNGANWQQQGGGDVSAAPLLLPGRPIFIVRPSGAGSDVLVQPKTY